MNQQLTGKFIAHKRKEKNLTQEQLAEKLGGSNVKDFFLDYCWEYPLLKCWLAFMWLGKA